MIDTKQATAEVRWPRASHQPASRNQMMLPIQQHAGPKSQVLYTQWEARLDLLHGKRLFIATPTPTPGAGRDGGYIQNPAQQAQQQAHLVSLKAVHRLLAGELIKAIKKDVPRP